MKSNDKSSGYLYSGLVCSGKAYSMITLIIVLQTLLLNTNPAYSELIVTDPDPDEVISGANNSFKLDFDDDTYNDIEISIVPQPGGEYDIDLMLSGGVEIYMDKSISEYPTALEYGFVLDNYESKWVENNYGMYTSLVNNSDIDLTWTDMEEHYLGIRIRKQDEYLYGWIGLKISPDLSSFTVTVYAFEDTPGIPVLCGHTGNTSAIAHYSNQPEISCYISGEALSVSFPGLVSAKGFSGAEIMITDIAGRKIAEFKQDSKSAYYLLPDSASTAIIVLVTYEGQYKSYKLLNKNFN